MWDIRPREGVGPLTFGMDPAAVAAAIGPAEKRNPEWNGTVNDVRPIGQPVCSYRDDRLIGVGFSARVPGVTLAGAELFALPPAEAIRTLIARNGGEARFGFDVFVFDTLAMTATDFYRAADRRFVEPIVGEQDDRGITVHDRPDPDWDRDSFPPFDTGEGGGG